MKPTIAFVDVLGLCYDGNTLERRGLGGSESAIILISKELVRLGFEVSVFNDCTSDDCSSGYYDGVRYLPLSEIQYEKSFDVFISSRTVAPFMADPSGFKASIDLRPLRMAEVAMKSKLRVLWMHDTFCDGDQLIEPMVTQGIIHKVFTLSDWHTSYITTCDHGGKRMFEVLKDHIFQTRNGIHRWTGWVDIREKDRNLFVYNASVTKGMKPLVYDVWPRLKKLLPDIKLKVIGGYYKFREDHGLDQQGLDWQKMVAELDGKNGLEFTGIITQKEISKILTDASWMIYPTAFPETFGISTLEALAHNVPLLTCRFGAMEETAIDCASYKIDYPIEPNGLYPNINQKEQVDRFVAMCYKAYQDTYLHQQKMNACNRIKGIETWSAVALQWKQLFYKELQLFLPVEQYRKVTDINDRVREVFGRRFDNQVNKKVRKQEEQTISIITPVYNASKYIDKCIKSVAAQDYDNWHMYIIDDCSSDRTLDFIECTLISLGNLSRKFSIIKNETNKGALRNQVETIDEFCNTNDIVILLDGDDWLVNDPTIFDMYNNLYHEGYEFTYGSCWSLIDNIPLIAQEYPPHVKEKRKYRQHKFVWNMPYTHLRTFKAELFFDMPMFDNQVDKFDIFKDDNGEWFKAGGDGALFYALIESVDPDRIKCVTDIVYNYNDLNPLCDYKVNGEEQTKNANKILGKTDKTLWRAPVFSCIMPTMWRAGTITHELLVDLTEHPLVGEVIIINNDVDKTPDWPILSHKKIRILPQFLGNIGVNPAWNLGAKVAKYDLLNFVNDDIIFDSKLFDKLEERLTPKVGAYGIITGEEHFGHPPTTDKSIDFIRWKDGDNIHCFGQCFFVHRDNWIPIPPEYKIYFGDEWVFHNMLLKGLDNYLIYNIDFYSPMAQTSTIPEIVGYAFEKERPHWYKYFTENPVKKEYPKMHLAEDEFGPVIVAEEDKTIFMKKKKILIAVPTAKYIEPDTMKSIYDQIIPEGFETEFQFFYGYQIDQIRNLIADWIVKGDYDYLFAVDSDVSFAPDTLQKMLNKDVDMITGIYRQRMSEQHLEIYDMNQRRMSIEQLPIDATVQIGACGFGCVLIKKHVFQAIPYPHFEYYSAIDHRNTVSEDTIFCRKVNEKGFQIFVDTSILCGHHGSTVFNVQRPVTQIVKKEDDDVQKRLRELGSRPLLPETHVNYLKKMKHFECNPKTIYDIGACVLHWTNEAEKIWPDAEFIAFEAMNETQFLYKEKGIRHLNAVLSDKTGKEVDFYCDTENPGGNSYYKERGNFFNETHKRKVKSMSLDDAVTFLKWPLPDLIKMDVQGAELDILKGAEKCLNHATDLILELQSEEYNTGAPLRGEVIDYLAERGFMLQEFFCDNGVDGDYHFIRQVV